jgi:LEA14-like dessication related protein
MPLDNDRATSSMVLGSFALFVLVFAASFGYTMQSYDAYLDAKPLDATVTGYELQESTDEPTLAVTVRVHNPTQRPIVVEGADLTGTIGDRKVARERPSEFPAKTIEPGTTETVRVPFWIYEHSESTIERLRNDDLDVGGFLEARVVDRKIEIDVTGESP